MQVHVQYHMPDFTRFIRASSRLVNLVGQAAKRWVPRKLAIAFVPFVVEGIKSNRYVYAWNPRALRYNVKYQEWKLAHFNQLKFWILRGELIRAITHFRMDEGYMAGVRPGAMDSGGVSWYGSGDKGPPKPIAMYARVLEYGGNFRAAGGGIHPPRPVFWPSLVHFRLRTAKLIGRKYMRTTVARAWT